MKEMHDSTPMENTATTRMTAHAPYEDVKVMSFVSFCLECYKARHNMSGRTTAALFQRYGVEKYLCEEYDVLHAFGERQILDYIERFIEVRTEAAT